MDEIGRNVIYATKLGFVIALVMILVDVVLPSPALFPFVAPGMWTYARLFGQPKLGPPEVWILLGIGMNAFIYAIPVLIARHAFATWQRKRSIRQRSAAANDK